MTINICDLSTEVLLHIFQYCSICDLCKLRESCKRFNIVINVNKIPYKAYDVLVTNQIKSSIRNRCKIILAPYEKWRISHNWKIGRYKPVTLLKQRKNFMPWLSLDSQFLWLSQGRYLAIYKRNKKHNINEKDRYYLIDGKYDDVVKFKLRENELITGQRNGSLWLWSLDDRDFLIKQPNCHAGDITGVDFTKEIYVSGSHDQTFKIWPFNRQNDVPEEPLYAENINDRIWSLQISPKKKCLAIGTAGFNNIPPFHIYDLERCKRTWLLGQHFIKGSGILDLHWENEHVILTCGYDTCLRKWDVRTGACERTWEDPHNAALYCLASDDLYSVLCGANMYGRVILWDQRASDFIQLYYTCTGSNRSSPVYSLSFDSTQLFTALDRCVKCLDFTDYRNQIKNYSHACMNYSRIRI